MLLLTGEGPWLDDPNEVVVQPQVGAVRLGGERILLDDGDGVLVQENLQEMKTSDQEPLKQDPTGRRSITFQQIQVGVRKRSSGDRTPTQTSLLDQPHPTDMERDQWVFSCALSG